MSPEDIIKQYKNEAQRSEVSSQPEMCRNYGTQSHGHMGYVIVSQDAEEEHEGKKLCIQSGCSFDEGFFTDIEAEVVHKVSFNIKGNKKYIIQCGS